MVNHIGEKIRELRTLSGLSQEELGNRVGVQRAAINKYEKSIVENIPIKTIEKLALVFDVSPTYLVGWNGENSNPLSAEVKIIRGVKALYGADVVELIESYTSLSKDGKKRVCVYVDDMTKIFGGHNL